MNVAPPLYISSAPTLTPARHGLFDAAEFVVADDAGRFVNGIEYQPAPCTPAKLSSTECLAPPADPDDPDPRQRDVSTGLPTTHAGPINVYNGFACKLPGLNAGDLEGYARAALAGGEQAAIEAAIWNRSDLALMGAGSDENNFSGVEELTASAVPLTTGIALLEDYLAANYGGVGVLHAPRGVSAFVAKDQQARLENGKLVTTVGTRWAFGNYPNTGPEPDGAEAAAGTAWIVATTAVNIRRGAVRAYPMNSDYAFNPVTNETLTLAERAYVVAWEPCVHVAALVTLT